MKKNFGFWTLTFLVIANMIGAGLFTTSGLSLGDLGSPHLVVLAWVVGGVIALSGAISYGMLARAIPESGGEYLFLSRAAHPMLGFIAGWVSLIAGFSGAIAFAATAFASYVAPDDAGMVTLKSIATASILVSGVCHGLRPRSGALIQNAVVLSKLVLLGAILVVAISRLSTGSWPGLSAEVEPLTGWRMARTFAVSLVWISLSYSGFNAAVYVAGESTEAKRVVPRALVVGTVMVLVLYVLLNAVFVYSSPPHDIKWKEDVAAIAAKSLGGPAFEKFVRWTIAACLLTSVLSMMMAAPRVYAKMANDGLMPAFLRFQGDSPIGATVLQMCAAVLLVSFSDLRSLLSYLGLTLSVSAACTASCLFLPKVRTRPLMHPIHFIPAFYISCTIVSAVLMIVAKSQIDQEFNPTWAIVGSGLTFLVGAVAYLIIRRVSKR